VSYTNHWGSVETSWFHLVIIAGGTLRIIGVGDGFWVGPWDGVQLHILKECNMFLVKCFPVITQKVVMIVIVCVSVVVIVGGKLQAM